jgi:hypothetical protein
VVGKLVGEHVDVRELNLGPQEGSATREELSTVVGFSRRGTAMVGRRSAHPRRTTVRGGVWSSGNP